MTEYCIPYFNEENRSRIDNFIEKTVNFESFLNIDLSENIESYDHILNCMKEKYTENSYFMTENELNEFESAKKRLNDAFEAVDEEDEDVNPAINDNQFDILSNIIKSYDLLFYTEELIFLPRMMTDHAALKRYISSDSYIFTRQQDGELIRLHRKSRIIILNKQNTDQLNLPRNMHTRMVSTSINSKNEFYEYINSRMNIIKHELMEKTWHPHRLREWCLSIQDLN